MTEGEEKTMSKELGLAKESSRKIEEDKSSKVELSMLKIGETFLIGEYEFIVLEHQDGTTRVISKGYIVEDTSFGDSRDYKTSTLKKVIEKNIQPMIETEVGIENIITHTVDLTSVDMQNEFGEVECKVRPITFDEARKYNDLLVNKDLDACFNCPECSDCLDHPNCPDCYSDVVDCCECSDLPDGSECFKCIAYLGCSACPHHSHWWWTCTPWSTKERQCTDKRIWKYTMAAVNYLGCFDDMDYEFKLGVRPFCILKSNIFVSRGVC